MAPPALVSVLQWSSKCPGMVLHWSSSVVLMWSYHFGGARSPPQHARHCGQSHMYAVREHDGHGISKAKARRRSAGTDCELRSHSNQIYGLQPHCLSTLLGNMKLQRWSKNWSASLVPLYSGPKSQKPEPELQWALNLNPQIGGVSVRGLTGTHGAWRVQLVWQPTPSEILSFSVQPSDHKLLYFNPRVPSRCQYNFPKP